MHIYKIEVIKGGFSRITTGCFDNYEEAVSRCHELLRMHGSMYMGGVTCWQPDMTNVLEEIDQAEGVNRQQIRKDASA